MSRRKKTSDDQIVFFDLGYGVYVDLNKIEKTNEQIAEQKQHKADAKRLEKIQTEQMAEDQAN